MKCLMWLYSITFNKKALKELERLPLWVIKRIVSQIEMLAQNPYLNWYKKLKNFNITWLESLSLYRIRVGNYRIIYSIKSNELKIEIIRIGHRKEIYYSH